MYIYIYIYACVCVLYRQRAYSGRLLLSAAECGHAPGVVRLAAGAPGADVNATNEVSRRAREGTP